MMDDGEADVCGGRANARPSAVTSAPERDQHRPNWARGVPRGTRKMFARWVLGRRACDAAKIGRARTVCAAQLTEAWRLLAQTVAEGRWGCLSGAVRKRCARRGAMSVESGLVARCASPRAEAMTAVSRRTASILSFRKEPCARLWGAAFSDSAYSRRRASAVSICSLEPSSALLTLAFSPTATSHLSFLPSPISCTAHPVAGHTDTL